MSSSSHNAASSALGYLYQSQWPLLELLQRGDERPDCAVTLELHDDVAWEQNGTPIELLQMKHHVQTSRSLGDKDMDVWRTVRAWMDTVVVGDPDGPLLTMVTTQTAAPGSAAAFLRPHGRDPSEALQLLEDAARQSQAKESAENRRRFLDLDPADRAIFVSRIYVLDASPDIASVDKEIRRVLKWGLPRGHEDTFMGLLWGWWYGNAIDMLLGRQHSVSAMDVGLFIDDLRDQFTHGNLPTLVAPDGFDSAEEASYLERRFVQQLRWVSMPARLIQKAIIDYYRAYQQTTLWVEDDLIGWAELESYEEKLRDEWDREFAWMVAALPEDADDQAKQQAGLLLLRTTLDRTGIRIRERYDEPFFCRGKHHELADRELIGWHPEFEQRLKSILLTAVNA